VVTITVIFKYKNILKPKFSFFRECPFLNVQTTFHVKSGIFISRHFCISLELYPLLVILQQATFLQQHIKDFEASLFYFTSNSYDLRSIHKIYQFPYAPLLLDMPPLPNPVPQVILLTAPFMFGPGWLP